MALLFDEDYRILEESGLEYEEDEAQRFLLIKNFPLTPGFYIHSGVTLELVEVLWIVPSDYNTSGGDMFWVHPALSRTDGKAIPNVFGFGGVDARQFKGKEYCRWSRHWDIATWKSKVDNIQKVLGRIEWALKYPDAKR
ncbi:MAG: hypothetical protein EG822_14635 [Deltaproteobacteria bacterium]|nr:hypothetical protein [Deltaproteobacteria bacterium]TLN01118.1 MAG: hypothetical protein FDZ73_17105 [bacterium]